MTALDFPERARRDATTPVRVTGLPPDETATITATTHDFIGGEKTASATFAPTGEGVVDTSRHAPVDGDWSNADAMAWLWALDGDWQPTGRPPSASADTEIEVEVRVDGDVVAEATHARHTGERVHQTDLPERFAGALYHPDGAADAPPVVVLHGADGRPMHSAARLLAAHGHAAVALRYFGSPDPVPDELAEVPLDHIAGVADWLREREDTADAGVALYGVSKGAEAALELAANEDWVRSLVAVAPTAYRWQALTESEEPTGSWTRSGEVLPFVPFRAAPGEDDAGNVVFRETYANSPDRVQPDRLDAARIEAEDIEAPALLVAGEADQMWPSADAARELADAMPNAELRVYDDAGHGIAPPHVPTSNSTAAGEMALGGTPAANARANADFWPAALDALAPGE